MVWKKTDDTQSEPAPIPQRPLTAATSEPLRRTDRPPATVGPSIFIKGDLSGEEDLVIEGRVEGKVDLKQHNVTIGKNGRVRADVFGRTVIVEGEVDGNLFAQEQAILRQSGAVRGNITAPRVMLEDGSRFRGSIDMESKETPKPAAAVPATASPSPTSPPSPPSPPSPSSPTSPGSPASPAIGPAAAGPPPPAANTEVGAAVAASRSS